jgi:hypothetical protein
MTPADETNHSRSQNGSGLISLANRHIEISRSVMTQPLRIQFATPEVCFLNSSSGVAQF